MLQKEWLGVTDKDEATMLLCMGVPLAPGMEGARIRSDRGDRRIWQFLPVSLCGRHRARDLVGRWRSGLETLQKQDPEGPLTWLRTAMENRTYLEAVEARMPEFCHLERGATQGWVNPKAPQARQDAILSRLGV